MRLTKPRTDDLRRVAVDVRSYFSDQEIERGARFARGQLALMAARGTVQLALLEALRHRWPSPLARAAARRSVGGGAVAGAAISSGLTAVQLPLAAIARRRAIAVDLVTQSWRGWTVDLLKATAIQSVFAAGAGAAIVAVTRR